MNVGPSQSAATERSLHFAAGIVVLWLAIHLGGILLFTLSLETAGWAAVLVLAQTWLSTGLFIIAHDCMHGSFAPGQPRLNDRIGKLVLALYACLDYGALKRAHFLHHRHAGLDGDPDFHPERPKQFMPWLLRFFSGYYTHTQLAWITLIAILYQLAGATLPNIVVFWAIPALAAMLQLFYFGTYLPHRHLDKDFPDRHRARSNQMGRAVAVLSCYNFGAYHHEHHLYPELPWWALPKGRAKLAAQRTL